MTNIRTLDVEEDPVTGDSIIIFPNDLMKEIEWVEGDTLDFKIEDEVVVLINLSLNERKRLLASKDS